jgi:hypothetical protein
MNIRKHWHHLCDWILHKTIFRSKAGGVDFYGINEEEAPITDGQVIVIDRRINQRVAYAFHFENRYMIHRPVGNRVMAVFQALRRIDGVSPLGMIENGHFYTEFGHYSGIPKIMRDVLSPA